VTWSIWDWLSLLESVSIIVTGLLVSVVLSLALFGKLGKPDE